MPAPFSKLPTPPKRICIVMMSALGDAMHTLPVIHSLKAADPTLHITWIVQHNTYPLVERVAGVDEFLIFDRRKGLAGFTEIRRELHKRRFDLVIALQVYFKAGLITAMIDAPIKLGFDLKRARDMNFLFTNRKIPAHPGQHVQNQYFEFLDYLDVPLTLEWRLWPTETERSEAAALLPAGGGKLLGMNVGTSKARKMWNPTAYARLVEHLTSQGHRVVLMGSPAKIEVEMRDAILAELQHPPAADLVGKTSMGQLLALLENLDLFVSPDTGSLHMAVSLGTPVVGIFAVTDPNRTGPYRDRAFTVDAYPRAVAAFGRKVKTAHPMDLIGWEEVAEHIDGALAAHDHG